MDKKLHLQNFWATSVSCPYFYSLGGEVQKKRDFFKGIEKWLLPKERKVLNSVKVPFVRIANYRASLMSWHVSPLASSVGSCRKSVADNFLYAFRRSRLSIIVQLFFLSSEYSYQKSISNLDLVWFRKQNSFFFNKNLISIDSVTNLSRSDNSDQIWYI